jgi:hypothetical protein
VASRASRDPIVTNQHDFERVAVAARAFVSVLFDDPRVRAFYLSWRDAVDRRELGVTVHELSDLALLVVDDVAKLDALLRTIGLDEYSAWLPKSLLREFWCAYTGDEVDWFDTPILTGWKERGRAPKDGETQQEDLKRNVSWFYRTRVKVPPDSVRSIAKEYAASVERETDARSVIRDGIRRAHDLLACVDVPDPPGGIVPPIDFP